MTRINIYLLTCFLVMHIIIFSTKSGDAGELSVPLDLQAFIETVTMKDTGFEVILIEQLKLAYNKDFLYPADDLLLRLKSEYQFFLDEGKSRPALSIGLLKLFPDKAQAGSLNYQYEPSVIESGRSDLELLFSQAIAENAFGKANQYLKNLIEIENDIIQHQIIEAYEDYLSSLLALYLEWQEAYQKFLIGTDSYKKNELLKDNILEREKQKIALPIDVNKVSRLLLKKKESLITLENHLSLTTQKIKNALRDTSERILIPMPADTVKLTTMNFEARYRVFTAESRTYFIMGQLEEVAKLNLNLAMDALLPSIDAFLGYRLTGESSQFDHHESILFGGVSLEWPFPNKQEKARHALSEIEEHKQKLLNQDRRVVLKLRLQNLYTEMEYQKRLSDLAKQNISLSESILEDESRNYSLGKVTLNDYIDAVNNLDESLFDKIDREIQYQILYIEFLRLTDQLIDKDFKIKSF